MLTKLTVDDGEVSVNLRLMGLPAASTQIITFGHQKMLCVERFDREWMDGESWIARLPQEDLCQATGTPQATSTRRTAAQASPSA